MSTRAGRAPIRRTPRPRDRRAQILAAASDLFYRFGYHNVGTEDIATAVGITPGALYRHVRSKEELLASALSDSFERATTVVDRQPPGGFAAVVADLAETAAHGRELGVLWTRETRHLRAEYRAPMLERFFVFLASLTAGLRDARGELSGDDAELLAWCLLAVLTSASYHSAAATPEVMATVLRDMALCVCEARIDTCGVSEEPVAACGETGLPPRVRREALLAAAARLFGDRGYQSVTMEEVGAEVGVTGAGVYRHFVTKADLLTAIVARATESLQLGMSRALSAAATPADGLANAVAAYIDFAMAHTDLVNVLVAEVMNVPQPYRHRIRRAEHDYVAEWVCLLAATHPELDRTAVLFRVHAVLTVVNDVARTSHLRGRPGLVDKVRLVAAGVLHA
ncbi:TetR/AcrR family transcriptional regulator [Frankia sp. QA3]|uniref:TetR/AcrR family transcriptional regulator n=1 Tax=Frankia sp. QA3 TaxID=710111 RepID=UPI000269C0FB|nr:TetR/AcrR family transcriptional regulator [Frankia sp. QA3]EIV92524.1 transcriptional regulator [Frankia sp. QA3]